MECGGWAYAREGTGFPGMLTNGRWASVVVVLLSRAHPGPSPVAGSMHPLFLVRSRAVVTLPQCIEMATKGAV